MTTTGGNGSAVHFKLILFNKDGDQKLETRRIVVDQGVSTSFQYLQEKIKSTFPGLHQGFKVTWTDADGDDVTIRTDEELVISLTEMTGPTYKLNVIKGDSEGHAYQPNQPGEVHQGITCDCCEGEVRGFRYKCLQCPDYDLCSVCEAKGVIHPGHNMIRIATPQGAWPQHFVRRLGRMQEKINNRRNERQENHEKRKNGRHSGQSFEPTCGGPPPFQGISQAVGQFLDMARMTSAGHAQAAMNKAASDAEKHKKQHEEAVKKAAEIHQRAMMQMVPGCPFTVDVSIVSDTDKENPNDQEDQKNTDDKKEKENTNSSSGEDETTQEFEWTVVGKDDAAGSPVNATVDATKPAPDAAATQEAAASSTASVDEEAADLAKETVDPAAKNEEKIILIQMEGGGEANETGTRPKDGKGALYPELPQEESQQPKEVPVAKHDDPRVQVALQAMLNMGFQNDGNWLTHLLEAKKGDIGKALDVIQPVQPKRK